MYAALTYRQEGWFQGGATFLGMLGAALLVAGIFTFGVPYLREYVKTWIASIVLGLLFLTGGVFVSMEIEQFFSFGMGVFFGTFASWLTIGGESN